MSIQEKGRQIIEAAKRLRPETSAEFSNAIFDQRIGLIAKAFPDDNERQKFYDTDDYRTLRAMLLRVRKAKPDPEKSGRFLVRIPKALHNVLECEAKKERVSLNQLATAKLAMAINDPKRLRIEVVAEAFRQIHEGYSTDRIVVDPDYNARFLKRCRELGLKEESDYSLNHLLYDIRKSGRASLPETTKPTMFRDYDSFSFAAEIAVRALQRSSGVSLDQALCDPEIRRKFDELAQRMAPEQPVLKLRCAALNLRKTHKLKPGDVSSPVYDLSSATRVESVDPDILPIEPGTYAFYDEARPLFAGESANLRRRIERHFAHSSGCGLPGWLDVDASNCVLRYVATPSTTLETRLSWLRQFINREKPLFNYQKAS